jgi:signal transduction histidine kinase
VPKLPTAILAVVAAMIVAVFVEFVVTPGLIVAVVFAVPITVAARFLSARVTILVGVIAIVIDFVDHALNNILFSQWPINSLSLLAILILAVQVATLRASERRRTQEAEASRARLSEFINLVVHDLRSPLTVAIGYLQLAERQLALAGDDRFRIPIDKSQFALRRIQRLVNDLLDAARIDHGRFIIQPESCDLAELTREVVDDQRLTDDSHQYIVDIPDQVTGDWDKVRLQQVLTNLVSNAAKYSAPGTGVQVQLRPDEESVLLSVTDQGAGIAASDVGQLFRPFARLGHEPQATGTGLGLYISKGIVEAHSGRVWVDSTVGRGSTFYVRLPRHPTPNDLRATAGLTGTTTADVSR